MTIERKYPHLAQYPFVLFGLDKEYTVQAVGTAECYDMIEYINNIQFGYEIAYEVQKKTMTGQLIKSGVNIWSNGIEPLIKIIMNSTK